ncbi:hypothetical protein B0O99DRAFT_342394 [Bisporella sp. PMI_857]|nr:hypothetical protein B0O99DRAFT_342394 [Bisporella sp. PMI_857]
MLCDLSKGLFLLAFCSLSSANSMAWNRRRDTTGSGISLYAYGGGTNGAPVFYDNGLAYIGYPALSSASTNITFTVDTNAAADPWYIAANTTDSVNSTAAFTGSPMFYIVPTDGSFEQAGFAANASAVPAGGKTTGFSWFGTSVAFAGSESDFEMAFWAVNTNTTGIWSLYWSKNNTNVDNSVSIVLKSTPPVSI